LQELRATGGWAIIVSINEDKYAPIPGCPQGGFLDFALNAAFANQASARLPVRGWHAQVCNTDFGGYAIQQLRECVDLSVAFDYRG
jgi:hypothetical protein